MEQLSSESPKTMQQIQDEQKLVFLSNGPANGLAPSAIIEASKTLFYSMQINYYSVKLRSEMFETSIQKLRNSPDKEFGASVSKLLDSGAFDKILPITKTSPNGRVSVESALNSEEITKALNSKDVSGNTRKYLSEFNKELKNATEEAIKQPEKKPTELVRAAISKLESKAIEDVSLTKEEKEIIFSYTIPTRDNVESFAKTANNMYAGSKTACWLCSIVNAIFTIVIAVAVVTVIGSVIGLAGGIAGALVGAAIGAQIGYYIAVGLISSNDCIVIADYGQQLNNGSFGFLDVVIGPC